MEILLNEKTSWELFGMPLEDYLKIEYIRAVKQLKSEAQSVPDRFEGPRGLCPEVGIGIVADQVANLYGCLCKIENEKERR